MEAELLASLTSVGPPPKGMSVRHVAAARRGLALKRVRVVARAWPRLRRALGDDFERVALQVLAAFPMASRFHAVSDGRAIAEHCRHAGSINDGVRIALLDVGVHWTSKGDGLCRRKLPWLAVARLPDSRRVAVAVRLIRTRIWVLPY
jgi:hypothetical protein